MASNYPLNLFPNDSAEIDIDNLRGEAYLKASAKLLLQYLWQNWDEDAWPASFFDKPFIDSLRRKHHSLPTLYRALLKEANPFFLKIIRSEIQQTFNNLYQTLLTNPPTGELSELKVQLAIHNMLSIYVMFSPTSFEQLSIPQKVDDQWRYVPNKITPIELTPPQGWWTNFISETDRVFSYGFSPIDMANAHSKLIHCGTGWPTAQGAAMQIIADLWPAKTPGEIFFEWQHQAIDDWLTAQTGQVVTAGQSLGGSLAYLTAMHQPQKIAKAYCLVPPGLSNDFDEHHPLFGAWEQTAESQRATVFIQKQKYDPISKFGTFKEDFKLVKISLKKELFSSHAKFLAAHARSFPTCNDAELEYQDMKAENDSAARQKNNFYLYQHARPWLFYGAILPYFLAIRPFIPLLRRSALMLLLTVITLLISLTVPAFATLLLSMPLINAIANAYIAMPLACYCVSYLLSRLPELPNLDHYVSLLAKCSISQACLMVLRDTANLVSFGALNGATAILKGLFYHLPNFFTRAQTDVAQIHSQAHYQNLQDLTNQPHHTFADKLQVFAILISFYCLALPIKWLCHDLPRSLKSIWQQTFGQQEVYITSEQEDVLPPEVPTQQPPPTIAPTTICQSLDVEQQPPEAPEISPTRLI